MSVQYFVCVEVKVRRLTFHLTRTQNATSMMPNFTNLLSMSEAPTHTQILFIVILQNFALKTEKEHEGKIILQKVHSELACVDAILRICIYSIDIFVLLILLECEFAALIERGLLYVLLSVEKFPFALMGGL